MTKKNTAKVDLRTLPADERPKPTTGQSRKEFTLGLDEMSDLEGKVLKALNAPGSGRRETRAVAELAKSTRLTALQVRNSIRRLVPSGWVERVETTINDDGEEIGVLGHYRVTERGRKRIG